MDATPTGSPPIPEPEYHLTFVDSTLPPVSLFRQILERLREPKFTVPKEYYRGRVTVDATPTGSPPVPGPEYHPTFVDSTLPPVSLFRQILERLREPKITVPKEYYRERALRTLRRPEVRLYPGLSTTPPSWIPPFHPFPFSGRFWKGSANRRSTFRKSITGERSLCPPRTCLPSFRMIPTSSGCPLRSRRPPRFRLLQSPSMSRRVGRIISCCWNWIRRP